MFHHNQIIVAAHLNDLVVIADEFCILCNFLSRYDLHTKILVLRCSWNLSINDRSVSEEVHLFKALKAVFCKTFATNQLASRRVPSFNFRVSSQHVQILKSTCLVEDWLLLLVSPT